jgi:hypothetical protein
MKAGWFQTAKSVFGRPEPILQTYRVPCDCGETVNGERIDAVQKPSCPTCGQTVFVLPASVYPVPESIRRRWSGIEESGSVALPKKKKASKKGSIPEDVPVKKQRANAGPPPVPWSQRRQELGAAIRKQMTPVRLVALGVALSVSLMSYMLYRQTRWSHAQSTVQSLMDAGHEAIAERRFGDAAGSLRQAAQALDILGRHDDIAATTRRLAREAAVIDGLADDGLPRLLAELFEVHEPGNAAARFSRRSAGQWILFDAPLYVSADGESRTVLLDLPLVIDDHGVDVRIDGQPWSVLLAGSSATQPKRVIFAAQLDRMEPAKKSQPAIVWLRSDTAVLWSERDLLAAMDMLPDDPDQLAVVETLLSDQQDWLKARK